MAGRVKVVDVQRGCLETVISRYVESGYKLDMVIPAQFKTTKDWADEINTVLEYTLIFEKK
ncbi:MAG: hypothetical protein MJ245_02735 [Clostridia bacterium]|nr:hypothetical protein [Clostridia bacterium]